MERNKVVLVNEEDVTLGVMDKLLAHQRGFLHRAFSIFVFNDNNELLLQQRASHKYHGGDLWTNTCCSHPQFGEDVKRSALERLQDEMGMQCELFFSHKFIYKAEVEHDLIEHELDYVYIGYSNAIPHLNHDEVKSYKWCSIEEVLESIEKHPEQFTYWFKEAFPMVIYYMELENKLLSMCD